MFFFYLLFLFVDEFNECELKIEVTTSSVRGISLLLFFVVVRDKRKFKLDKN